MTIRLPGEFEPHERTVLCWPARKDLYGDHFARAEEAHASVANAILEFEPVTVLVDPEHSYCAKALCNHKVELVEMPMDDSWFRDTGPIYVYNESGEARTRIATDWIFNGWGEKFKPYELDATLASRWSQFSEHPHKSISMVLEGGSISSNGAGILVTTEQCLLNTNRNPQLTKAQIEERLKSEFGVEHVLWLPYGLALDADTDGHVDNVAAFADAETLVLQGCSDPTEEDLDRLFANRLAVDEFIRLTGINLKIVEVPHLPFTEVNGERLVVPYLNFYVGNGFVLVPTCDSTSDDEMLELIGSAYPSRKIVPLDVGVILAIGGGGIHCITQQIPAQ